MAHAKCQSAGTNIRAASKAVAFWFRQHKLVGKEYPTIPGCQGVMPVSGARHPSDKMLAFVLFNREGEGTLK